MLTICTWLWGDKFGPDHVARLAAGLARHLKQEHRFRVFGDRPLDLPVTQSLIWDEELTRIKGCYARLRVFDPRWQMAHELSGRIVCVDLDTVITGPLDPLFDRDESFVIMQGGNAANPCPYNGALMMLRAQCHSDVWYDFSVGAAAKVPFYEFPDDQGWLAHKVPRASGWRCGQESGVYVFRKPGWPCGDDLPAGARLVTFNGARSPEKFTHLDWVNRNWRT